MTPFLKEIKKIKMAEVNARYEMLNHTNNKLLRDILLGARLLPTRASFYEALKQTDLAVIAEIKYRSPSKGMIAEIADPINLAKQYVAGDANAISILTDKTYFNGDITDLNIIAEMEEIKNTPILRKDFIIDNIQIADAYLAGASAVLIIIALTEKKSHDLIAYAHSLHLDVLVEAHDSVELALAMDSDAKIIGVNNRNLNSLIVNTDNAFDLVSKIPHHYVTVAESGIHDPLLARQYHAAGFNAVLIGEALVKTDHPSAFIRACKYE